MCGIRKDSGSAALILILFKKTVHCESTNVIEL